MRRKTFSALLVLLAATSCTDVPDSPELRYSVGFELEPDDVSKTALQVDGRKVSFFWNNEAPGAFRFLQRAEGVIRLEPGTSFSVNFDGKASVGAEFSVIPGASAYDYVGIYPSGAIPSAPESLSSCCLILPSAQALEPETFDPEADLMFSKPVSSSGLESTFSLELRRLAAVGRMNILNLGTEPGEKIQSIRFGAPGAVMNGEVKVNLLSGKVISYGPGTDSVLLQTESGFEAAPSLSAWFTCFPFSLASGREYDICIRTDRHCYIKHGKIPSETLSFKESSLTTFNVDMAGITPTDFITYEQYGAKGDGVTDDMPAIIAAHTAANDYNLPVVAGSGRTYLIGNVGRTARIKTDVNWGDARFIINDVGLDKPASNVFVIGSRKESFNMDGLRALKRGDTSLGSAPGCPAYVYIENSNRKIFIRNGSNANNGSSQSECLLVSADGSIDALTPVTWDYDAITSAVAYPVDEDLLTVRGGIFTTRVNPVYSEEYYSRCIVISRSNTRVVGLTHYLEGEGEEGAPYHGFINVSNCANVILDSLLLSAHRTYYKIGATGKPSAMGSYDMSMSRAVNVIVRNCSQTTSITDPERWGIMGSNFCRNIRYENCELSRFDAHQGVYNATISGCTLAYVGCTGFGTLTIEDCEIHSSNLITFRGDYGSFWRGTVSFKGCRLYPAPDAQVQLVHAYNYGTHDFGYDCMLPTTITFDGLKVYDGNVTLQGYAGPWIFSNVTRKSGAAFSYKVPDSVNFSNLWVESGKPVTLGPSSTYYSETKINGL